MSRKFVKTCDRRLPRRVGVRVRVLREKICRRGILTELHISGREGGDVARTPRLHSHDVLVIALRVAKPVERQRDRCELTLRTRILARLNRKRALCGDLRAAQIADVAAFAKSHEVLTGEHACHDLIARGAANGALVEGDILVSLQIIRSDRSGRHQRRGGLSAGHRTLGDERGPPCQRREREAECDEGGPGFHHRRQPSRVR